MATTTDDDTKAIVQALIQTQVLKALNSAPEYIDKLVTAALAAKVDYAGNVEGSTNYRYTSNAQPYLEHMLGEEIRMAARRAVVACMRDESERIEAQVREALAGKDVVAAVTRAIAGAAAQDWKIEVKFAAEDERRR